MIIIPLKMNVNLTYYVSGPMTGYDDYNFPAFKEVTLLLRTLGLKIISPHETESPGEGREWEDFLRRGIHIMTEAVDGIILLKGWPKSKGARAELDVALTLGMPVYYYNKDVLVDMNQEK